MLDVGGGVARVEGDGVAHDLDHGEGFAAPFVVLLDVGFLNLGELVEEVEPLHGLLVAFLLAESHGAVVVGRDPVGGVESYGFFDVVYLVARLAEVGIHLRGGV